MILWIWHWSISRDPIVKKCFKHFSDFSDKLFDFLTFFAEKNKKIEGGGGQMYIWPPPFWISLVWNFKIQLPSSTSIGGKKQGFGVPQNLGDLDPQNDRFFVFGNWLKTRKSVEFSVHSTLIMKAKSWILQKHNIKIKLSENQKNTKSLCLDRTQNHRFLVQKCEKWAEIAQLRAGERVGR